MLLLPEEEGEEEDNPVKTRPRYNLVTNPLSQDLAMTTLQTRFAAMTLLEQVRYSRRRQQEDKQAAET